MLYDHKGNVIGSTVHQELEVGPENVRLTRVLDLEPALKANHRERMFGEQKGFTRGRTMRKIASIPIELFFQRPELADDACLRDYLRRHPGLCTVDRFGV